MASKVYNANEITLNIAGALISEIGGWADGEFLRVEMDSDAVLDVVGTDGEVAAGKSNDKRGTLTLSLLQTSAANDVLSALYNLQQARPGLVGAGPLYARDRQGRTTLRAPACWIAKPPDISLDRTATARAWKIRVGELDRFDGGNNVIGA